MKYPRSFTLAAVTCFAAFLTRCAPAVQAETAGGIDWKSFLRRHDIAWETLPQRFDHGAFHGNGLLGCMIYRDGPRRLRWECGRSDVTAHRRDNNRLPIGGMVLETAGAIEDGTIRLDLRNAESTGEVRTTKGTIAFRTFIHAIEMFTVVEITTTGDESDAAFTWLTAPAVDRVNQKRFKDDPPNPPARRDTDGAVSLCVQPRQAGGEYATGWKEVDCGKNTRRLFISIADTFPGDGAGAAASAAVRTAAEADFARLVRSHRDWWHAYYPRSFLSVPNMQVEGFYWAQIYKLASATRGDRMVMDLLGPWFRRTGWPRIWWNLNIEVAYLLVYASNHLAEGSSLTRMIDRNRENFRRNAREIWNIDNGATVPHTTCYEGLRGDGSRAPDRYVNPGDFTWALHNYYLHYRYSMNHEMVTNHEKHAFYPLLRDSVNVYLHLLKKGDDGKLHLPVLHSPEYGTMADNNYNLSLLRWACRTLIALCERYGIDEPLVPRWKHVLAHLVDYPTGENGLLVGAGVPYAKSHRHWSHMLMVFPLRLMDLDDAENRRLVERSVKHWLAVQGGRQIYGWSRAAASCLYSTLGDGDNALDSLLKHHNHRRFVMPNTMYIEGSPVIECALFAAKSLQDMLIQSWGDRIRIFPAVPGAWKDAVFGNLRAEGAFLVSAARRDGRTRWVKIRSLAGEPCRVVHSLDGTVSMLKGGAISTPRSAGTGVCTIDLAKNEEALLFAGDKPPAATVAPLPAPPEIHNFWGCKKDAPRPGGNPSNRKLSAVLSSGKSATASSSWSRGYSPEKAFDDNEGTRWGAKSRSRSGWLAVDLGAAKLIGGVEIREIGFPRTEEFVVEYRTDGEWKTLVKGTAIGGRKTFTFTPVTARHVRLTIIRAKEVPTLEEFRVLAPEKKPAP